MKRRHVKAEGKNKPTSEDAGNLKSFSRFHSAAWLNFRKILAGMPSDSWFLSVLHLFNKKAHGIS